MKFSPDTHKTRCGKPWRLLEIKQDLPVIVIIVECVNSSNLEVIMRLDEDGTAYNYSTGKISSAYSLIEIPLEPVPLPLGLNYELRYARWSEKAKRWQLAYDRKFTFPVYLNPRLWSMDCANYHKDHIHRRINIGLATEFWERVPG